MTSLAINNGLTLIATPIGNLRDVTFRAIDALMEADQILCEDTRVSRKLLTHYSIKTKLTPYHEYNATSLRPKIIRSLQQGKKIALISDAGTPNISDPGYKLIESCLANDIQVSTIPGPTAIIAALSISGLPTDNFYFGGFLPSKTTARKKTFASLKTLDTTLIFYESPARLVACLHDSLEYFAGRTAVVARELTKLHEDVRRAEISELYTFYKGLTRVKGEIVFLISPPQKEALYLDHDQIKKLLKERLANETLKDAVKNLAREYGISRSLVYRLALEMKNV
tara:strand:+ start:931 stop:1779 length:849 start_codon:yes stop_codon:yes gene_type:complete